MFLKTAFFLLLVLLYYSAVAQSGVTDSISTENDTLVDVESQIADKLFLADEIHNSNIQDALFLAKQALEEAQLIKSKFLIAESKLAIGIYYSIIGINAEALNFLSEALILFKELNDPYKQVKTIQQIGNIYWYSNEYNLALDYYNEVIQYSLEIQDTSLIISGLISSGAVYGNINKMDSALILFNQAFNLSRIRGNRKLELLSLFNIGDVLLFSGDVNEALRTFHDIEEMYEVEKINSFLLPWLYNSITQAYIELKNIDRAKYYSDKTEKALNKYPSLKQQSDYYYQHFRIDTLSKKYQAGIANYLKFKALNDSASKADFHEQLANFETLYEVGKKEGQIATLLLDNRLKDYKIRQRKFAIYGLGGLFLLVFVFTLFVYRSRKRLSTKNKELEELLEELRTTQQHLIQSDKMASLGTLVAGVAHEINNPLNFINGGLEIVKATRETENHDFVSKEFLGQLDEAFSIIESGYKRASIIVDSLMTFSYKGKSKLIEYDVVKIIESTLLFLNSKISDKIEIIKNYQDAFIIKVYPDKLHQVFLNIFDNALYALNQSKQKDKRIEISTSFQTNKHIIVIVNNGPLIPEESINKIFDPFFTTKAPGIGTGLGMSISYNLIAEHKGRLFVKNIDGKVEFTIELPELTI